MVSPLSGGNNMSKALKCDRCGKFFEHKDMEEKCGERERVYYIRTSFFDAPNSVIDLCPECYGKLEKWMEANENDS